MSNIEDDRFNIDFNVARSLRYHAYRRSFWDSVDNGAKILTIVSGTAVLVSIVGFNGFAATALAFIVAFASALDVVLGFSARYRTHDSLYRAFSQLAQNIAANPHPDDLAIAQWRARRLEIEMDEPGVMDWLERRCAAEEAVARERDTGRVEIDPLAGLVFAICHVAFTSARPCRLLISSPSWPR